MNSHLAAPTTGSTVTPPAPAEAAGVRRYALLTPAPRSPATAETVPRHSPADGRLVAEYVAGSRDDTLAAVRVAREAFDSGPWPRLTGQERAKVLFEWIRLIRESAEQLARIEVDEVGKPITVARGDIDAAIELFEVAAALAPYVHGDAYENVSPTDLAMVLREPVGVVAAITAWNFPSVLYASKVPFALAAGCTVISKPSELASGTTLELTQLGYQAGVDPGALQVITGYGATAGQPLAETTDVDLLSFTGSTRTGGVLAGARRATPQRQALELGGKGATVVFADADLDAALAGAIKGFCFNQGETCTAGTRLLIQDEIADEFLDRLVDAAGRLTVGDPYQPDTDLGPLISAEQLDKVLRYIGIATEQGARIRCGGTRLTGPAHQDGYFIGPTIIDEIATDNPAYREEIFGPVLTVARFNDRDEAIALTNDTSYGLANGVWTRDLDNAMRMVRAMRSGIVWVNSVHAGPGTLPFGGVKGSGFGREKGPAGLDEFTALKTAYLKIQ